MSELLRGCEPRDRCVTVYSGTTLGNYRTGAFVDGEGQVFFDKTRNRRHDFKETFFGLSLRDTFDATAAVAYQTSDIPVIMIGQASEKYMNMRKPHLPEGVVLPVSELLVPKDGVDVEDLLSAMFAVGIGTSNSWGHPMDMLEPVNPVSVLAPTE